ncbi:MAG: IS3 family transposase [Ignavibacteriaceae bacterium]|nr:IS3 family transposase [Ignavibacteriaceae bacterium]
MDEYRSSLSLEFMCGVLEVSRSGYYSWKGREHSTTAQRRKIMRSRVDKLFKQFKKRYGAIRLTRELKSLGIACSHNYVASILRELGVRACNGKGFRYSKPNSSKKNIQPNLLGRNFKTSRPNEKWVTDITYIRVNGKWLYLAAVMDLCSKAIVGWSLANHMMDSLINEAFEMAISRRKITGTLLVHSDQGIQYRSNEYQQNLLSYGCQQSMSRKGNCWDNAAMESFFSRLKVELVYAEQFKTFDHAKLLIFEYIEVFYNRIRRHSANNYLSPMQFEQQFL